MWEIQNEDIEEGLEVTKYVFRRWEDVYFTPGVSLVPQDQQGLSRSRYRARGGLNSDGRCTRPLCVADYLLVGLEYQSGEMWAITIIEDATSSQGLAALGDP